jgi:exonuclease SbcC
MIVESVHAHCLHRYRSLRLADLPERGIIAVSGDNETGKSAIGEVICFALFGRTQALGDERIHKLVHWGAGQGSVVLRFQARGRRYEVMRGLARDGEQSARLVALDQAGEPLARGAEAVTARVESLLGYGFDAYVETFYLAQREITTPPPHSPAVKAMAGIAPLERCAAALRAEADTESVAARACEERIAALEAETAALDPDHERVEALKAELAGTRAREGENADRLAALSIAGEEYCRSCRGRGTGSAGRVLGNLLSIVLVLAALILGVVWTGLALRPELWPMPALRAYLEGLAGGFGLALDTALIDIALLVGGGLLVVWSWLAMLALSRLRCRVRARRLSEELDRVDAMAPTAVSLAWDDDLLGDGEPSLEAGTLVDAPDAERRARLQQRILGLAASAQEVQAALRHETAWLGRRVERLKASREALQRRVERAGDERENERVLTAERRLRAEELVGHREAMEVRRLACELLGGAAGELSERFSERLRGMVSKALPQFTEGRYDHLQVDAGLEVRVYSGDKRNLLELDEISSGTQRQIMLALRLGLAQELVSRMVRDAQYVFLDEPFAFFDSGRMRAALSTLTGLGGDLTQHWVVAQRFPRDVQIGLEIACGGHPDTLEIGSPLTE